MRVVHLTRTLDPAAGGLPVVPVRLAAAQAAAGLVVAVYAERDAAAGESPPAVARGVPGVDRVDFGWLPPAGRAAMLGRGPAPVALRAALAGADVLHLHGVWEPVAFAAARAARALGVPYAVAPHGMLDPWSLAQKRWKKRLALALGWRGVLNRAAFLHALNADEADLLGPLRLTAPVEVIPNGVFLEEIEPLPPAEEFGAPRPYVLFLSRLHMKKGLDVLADAFARLAKVRPDVSLVVAGPDGGARADFERRVAAAGVSDRVRLTGPLAGRTKWAALAGAAAFCLPSRQEGFSMAILEALAARVPAVVTDACHFPEVASAGAGRVVALDAAAVARGLAEALDPAAGRAMGAAGRELVEGRFTWAQAAARSLEAYARIRP